MFFLNKDPRSNDLSLFGRVSMKATHDEAACNLLYIQCHPLALNSEIRLLARWPNFYFFLICFKLKARKNS